MGVNLFNSRSLVFHAGSRPNGPELSARQVAFLSYHQVPIVREYGIFDNPVHTITEPGYLSGGGSLNRGRSQHA